MLIKFLHTRIRVSDLEKSINFYSSTCGFEVFKRNDKSPSGNQIVHLQLPGNEHMLELTYSPDYKVEFPEDLMHTCIGVDDIVEYCGKLEDLGVEVWPGDWKDKFTSGGNKMAFITDPDGYEVEILEN
ncbi:VOC family protein [Puniceicoccus vermicola]|uniref:VOC family protein n=1 Tax=Puniceicoccus vermicola TaxID=388746 RepID=A0A7X1B276_9BACT|nr:VOC family protein [Puniceicoccus vermicola]MBC2604197.1 VOC family protein [Puniceicoccus vermicola]